MNARNDRGLIKPPDQIDYQGGYGLTSYVQGQRFGDRVARCRLVFEHDYEIQSLAGAYIQAAAIAARTPSIAIPQDDVTDVLSMLRQGCYVRLSNWSGFPAVLLRDAGDPDWHGRSLVNPGGYDREVAVTKSSIYCPPMQWPMVLPPMERYVNGYATAEALYPIGGWISNTDYDYLRFECWLECSLEPFESRNGAYQWSGCFIKRMLADQADKHLYSPLFTLVESEDIGAANVALCGNGGIRAPSNMTNVSFWCRTYAYDRDTALGVGLIGAGIDDQGDNANLTKEMMTAYCFLFHWFGDYEAPDGAAVSGDIPALTHFQVTL